MTRVRVLSWLVGTLLACDRTTVQEPALQVLGESTRVRIEDPLPQTSPWFDGTRVSLVAARGETLGLQILHRDHGGVRLRVPGVEVRMFTVDAIGVTRPSTAMYGGSHGRGTYADGLTPAEAPRSNPAYVEIVVGRDAAPGHRSGELRVGDRVIPVDLSISAVSLIPTPPLVWAYADPRELGWMSGVEGEPPRAAPSPAELACHALFRAHGVLLTPDVRLDWWPARRAMLEGAQDLPVWIPSDPELVGDVVRGWIAATRGTGHVPFAIPIDEPSTPARQARVVALATAVRAAGGGPRTFRYAVTDAPRGAYGDLIDLYIQLAPRLADHGTQWTYNGAPPRAGSLVLDAATPGVRTWGWIAWRWGIPVWYVWDALYWHDRHNRRGAALPGRALDVAADAVSFDDGDDHGNLDGVLALPGADGCRPTLRLAALWRGQQDRALLELAARCAPAATAALAAQLVPRALGDAPKVGAPAWPTDEAAWERARRRLLELADCPQPSMTTVPATAAAPS